MLTLVIVAILLAVLAIPIVAKVLAYFDYVAIIGLIGLFVWVELEWHMVFVILCVVACFILYTALLKLRIFGLYIFRLLISLPLVLFIGNAITNEFSPDVIWRVFNMVLLTGVLIYTRVKDNGLEYIYDPD